MIITTTNTVEGRKVREYKGIVFGETVMGANVVRDFMASITDFIGGRSGAYEESVQEAREIALTEMSERAKEMGADAVLSVDVDYETIGSTQSMMMVTASGTAVVLE